MERASKAYERTTRFQFQHNTMAFAKSRNHCEGVWKNNKILVQGDGKVYERTTRFRGAWSVDDGSAPLSANSWTQMPSRPPTRGLLLKCTSRCKLDTIHLKPFQILSNFRLFTECLLLYYVPPNGKTKIQLRLQNTTGDTMILSRCKRSNFIKSNRDY